MQSVGSGRKRRVLLVAAVATLSLVAAACGGGDDGGDGSGGSSSSGGVTDGQGGGTPVQGGTVAYGLEAENDQGWCLPEVALPMSGIQVARTIYGLIQEIPFDQIQAGLRVEAVWVADEELSTSFENIKWWKPSGEPDADPASYADYV